MKKIFKQTIAVITIIFITAFNFTPNRTFAANSISWNSKSDFSNGVNASTSIEHFSGDITLERKDSENTHIITTSSEFRSWGSGSDLTTTGLINVKEDDDGEIVLGKKYRYGAQTDPSIASNDAYHSFNVGENNEITYISTAEGLAVFDNKGTFDTSDDKTLVIYNTASSPAAIGGNFIYNAWLDEESGLLYISNESTGITGGLSVVDTKKTKDPSDDETLITYNHTSTPAISMDADQSTGASFSFMDPDTNYLYIGGSYSASATTGGVSVVDTKGTIDVSDDVLVTAYTKSGSSARLLEEDIHNCVLADNILYCIGNDKVGIAAIDTKGTADPSDDTSFAYRGNASANNGVYNTTDGAMTMISATPKIPNISYQDKVMFDNENNILYLTGGEGIVTIHTQGTADFSDDRSYVYSITGLYETTNDASGVQLSDEIFFPVANETNQLYIYSVTLDNAHNQIYAGTYHDRLVVINTQGTVDPADDILGTAFPDISEYVNHVGINSTTKAMQLSTYDGFIMFKPGSGYINNGSYVSKSFELASIPAKVLSWNEEKTSVQNITAQYRTEGDIAWRNDFDDGDSSEYAGDYFDWGSSFGAVEESEGTLKLSDTTNKGVSGSNEWIDFWIDTGENSNYFPIYSTLSARLRVVSDTREKGSYNDYVFTDQWYDNDYFWGNNEWFIISIPIISKGFGQIGFDINWKAGTWNNANDYVEIDWIKIEEPGDWSAPCTSYTACPIDQDSLTEKKYLQYRLNLETADSASSPAVTSVALADNYENTGVYESENIEFDNTATLYNFDTETTIPEGTSIDFQYSFDNGETWNDISANEEFPFETKTNSFKWKAIFSAADITRTPVIHSVSLSTDQADLTKIKEDDFSLNSEDGEDRKITFTGTNYLDKRKMELRGVNKYARNGEVILYEKKDTGSKKEVDTSPIDAEGNWKIDLPKKKNSSTNYYYLKFIDSVGNESETTKKFKIKIDTAGPSFKEEYANKAKENQPIQVTKNDKLIFTAEDEETKIDYYKIKVLDKNGHILRGWKEQKEPSYFIPDQIKEEAKTIIVRAYDKAGNKSELTFDVNDLQMVAQSSSRDMSIDETEKQKAEVPQVPTSKTQETQSFTNDVPQQIMNESQETPEDRLSAEKNQEESQWWNPFSWF